MTMTEDDARHGSEAGYSAHARAGQAACDLCQRAKVRGDKRRRVLGSGLVPVPSDVRRILDRYSNRTIEQRTGVSVCAVQNIRERGEKARAYPATISRLRSVKVPTNIGVVRRVRALARLGWSAPQIAAHAPGVPYTTIAALRDRDDRQWVGRESIRDAIAAAYSELCMCIPPLTRHSSKIANRAAARGWPPPLAWNDIDNDDAPDYGGTDTDIDPVVVMRLLEGRHVTATKAEKEAAMARWVADGAGSRAELARMHGWKPERYTRRLRLVEGEAS